KAPRHRDGDARRLALDQIGGGGEFVGEDGHGDVQRPAIGIGAAAQVVDELDARRADGGVGLADAPGAAEGVGDDEPEAFAGFLPQAGAQGARRGVGVARQAQGEAIGHVGGVEPGGGHDEALAGFDDFRRPARMGAFGYDPDRILLDGDFTGGERHLHALGFRDDLGGDDEDIAIFQRGLGIGGGHGFDGVGDDRDEV